MGALLLATLLQDLAHLPSGLLGETVATDLALAAMLPPLVLCAHRYRQSGAGWFTGRAAAAIFSLVLIQVLFAAIGGGFTGIVIPQGTLWLSAALIPAALGQVAAEELLFRLIVPLLVTWAFRQSHRPPVLGIVISGVFFVPWHGLQTFSEGADHFLFALLMSFLLARSISLWVPIWIHLATNLVAIYLPSPEGELGMVLLRYAALFAAANFAFYPQRRAASRQISDSPHRPIAVRITRFDALRGVALGVILVENAILYLPSEWTATAPSFSERAARAAVAAFFEFRGLPLFAILIGFAIYSVLRRDAVADPWKKIRARDKVLILLGAMHGTLVFSGDILTVFGLLALGGGLMLRRRWSQRWLLPTTAVLFLVQAALTSTGYALGEGNSSLSATSWLEACVLRVIEWTAYVASAPLLSSGLLFPVLVGFACGPIIWNDAKRPGWFRTRNAVLGLGVSLLLAGPGVVEILLTYGQDRSWMTVFFLQLSGLMGAVSLFVLTAVIRPGTRYCLRALSQFLAPLGRRTLTVYLASSVAYMVLLAPFSLDLARHISLVAILLGAGIVFVAIACWAWLGRDELGVVERFSADWVKSAGVSRQLSDAKAGVQLISPRAQ